MRTSLPLLFTMTAPSRVKKPFRLVPAAQAENLSEVDEARHAALSNTSHVSPDRQAMLADSTQRNPHMTQLQARQSLGHGVQVQALGSDVASVAECAHL